MAKYRYAPIDSAAGQIRLLALLPSTKFEAEVQIQLTTAVLSETSIPKYEALSYVWGSAENPEDILIDGSTLAVTQALAQALPYLRYEDRPRILWIDAICVNQEDLEERGRQVERMATLYSCARRVVVWLGAGTRSSQFGLQTLETLRSKISYDIEKDLAYPPIQAGIPWTAEDPIIPYDENSIKAIISLLQRQWFERLWIVQEIRLANDQAVIQAGHKLIKWDAFICSCYYLRSKFQNFQGNEYLASEFQKSYLRIQPLGVGKPQVFEDLQRLIWDTRNAKCTDPRDRVYGLLSVVHKSYAIDLRPDYRKSVSEVYQDVVLHILERSKSLRLLTRCELDEFSNNGIPSWAPNLAIPCRYQLPLRDMDAAGVSITHARYLGNGILGVKGTRVATVSQTYSLVDVADSEIAAIKTIQYLVNESLITSEKLYPRRDKESVLSAACRTFNRNLFLDYWQPPKGTYPTFPQGRKALNDILAWKEGEKFADMHPYTQRYLQYFRPLAAGRSFFITHDGNAGLAPQSIAIGDTIVVILGVDSAMAFRNAEEFSFKVVGEAYLDGFTSSEALLGPLKDGWVRMSRFDEGTMAYWGAYLNIITNAIQIADPRLGALPDGWKIRKHGEDRVWNWFVKEGEEEVEKQSEFERWRSDPRLTAEYLIKMGVAIEEFRLV
ncbi:heterokaryon incompatibility protein-domain-containing protein [Xylaria cubensis]|nr:heterokaryon incompatibility protein-domain-containing protein [Xylaria cubensis]